MLRIVIAVIILGGIRPVFAATCGAGQYMDSATGKCARCQNGYYCPDDTDDAIKCPPDTTDYTAHLHAMGITDIISLTQPEVVSWSETTSIGGTSKITDCWADVWMVAERGKALIEKRYNTNTGDYWDGDFINHWYEASPGWYLYNYNMASAYKWYRGIKRCTNTIPEHGYYSGPGEPDVGNCPIGCDSGYGLHDTQCLVLCTAGFRSLRAGNNISFNIYRDKPASPTLAIGFNNNVCYVYLKSGAADSAINLKWDGQTYRTTD